MAEIDLGSPELLHLSNIVGLRLLHGSDHHISLADADQFIAALIESTLVHSPDAVVMNGDLYNASKGEPTQEATGDLLRSIAHKFDGPIIYVPGNHCLRGAGEAAWGRFGSLPPNVRTTTENPLHPLTIPTASGDIVAGNLFYDFKFIDPVIFGLTEDEIHNFYRNELPDGFHLLGGHIDNFGEMADNLTKTITPNTKILITHCVPHPTLVQFRMAAPTTLSRQLETEHGINFFYGSEKEIGEAEAKMAKRWNMSVQEYRDWWNMKGFAMGSNVLKRDNFPSPPDGLRVISGHNHRSEYGIERSIGGRRIIFYAHQGPFRM
jgi:hypothetical protein